MPCYHKVSDLAHVPARMARRDSISSLRSESSISEDDTIIPRPSITVTDINSNNMHGVSGWHYVRNHGHLYICCQCQDGPKLYDVQPRCVSCQHIVCASCHYVK